MQFAAEIGQTQKACRALDVICNLPSLCRYTQMSHDAGLSLSFRLICEAS